MKKQLTLLTASLCVAGLLAGCSSTSKGTYDDYLTLGEYKGIELNVIKTEVTDEMVQDEIDTLLEDNATYTEITDRPAEEGDTVNVDYTGTIDGEAFDGGSAEDFELILGDGYLLDELEAGIVGMTPGDTTTINATFPEDYDGVVDGKDAVFTVTLNSISEENIPEYTDAFVAEATEYSTIAEYEENMRADLLASTEADNRSTAGYDALNTVIKNSTFNGYPQELFDSCKEEYDAMNQMYAEMFGMDVEELDADDESTKAMIEELVYEKMVVTAIAEAEKLTLSDEEYQQYLKDNYELYGYSSTQEYEETETEETIREEALSEKIQDFLVDNANVTEVTEDEYYDSYEDEYYDEDEDYEDEEWIDDKTTDEEVIDDGDTDDVEE